MNPYEIHRTLIALFISSILFSFTVLADESPTLGSTEIQQAFAAVESADNYRKLVEALEQYEATLGSTQVIDLADTLLQMPEISDQQRDILQLERALALDIRQYGTASAAQLSAIRLIAYTAVSVQSPQNLAQVMENFSELSGSMTPQLVNRALGTANIAWPVELLPLMLQLGLDWPAYGALAAATRMAETAGTANHSSNNTEEASQTKSWEDRAAESIINSGRSVPDGLIYIPSN